MPIMTLPFYKLSPGGNPTILIRDNALFSEPQSAPALRSAIAGALMAPDHLGAEQVGFLDTSRALPHMEMMGGEFCVNATLCAAFVFARMGLLPTAGEGPGIHAGAITTSGSSDPVRVRVNSLPPETNLPPETVREAAIALPLPAFPAGAMISERVPGEVVVRLPGITHLLLDAETHPLPCSPLEAAGAKRAEYGLDAEEAVGVIWHWPGPGPDPETTRAILPVVHVAATGSAVAETACGSGSLALALLLARGGATSFSIRQPSGHDISITLERPASGDGSPLAWISATVYLTAEGTTSVHGMYP